ncbi:MAG: lipocalin-like domain-containing protein [Acidobacteriaceae bacterium]
MKNRWIGLLLLPLLLGSGWAQNYVVALPGYQYQFPRDDFNHPQYQTEWWYYTGNLKSADGHRFGFELTFFRQGVDRRPAPSSDWNIRNLYLAHLALSDLSGHKFFHTERLNRAGPGIAGIDEQSGIIWNGNWQVHLGGGGQQLQAIADGLRLQLSMVSRKPPVINGVDGVSQKSEGAGNASHYISFTRLLTQGSIKWGGKNYQVEGNSWMDHEFFTSKDDDEDEDIRGWDWLSIQLEDNAELMLYRLRRKDGSVGAYSSGTFVDASGASTHLSLKDFVMDPTGAVWTSPQTHATYPIAWRVAVPGLGLVLNVSTPLQSQELASTGPTKIAPSYWEGAVDFNGTRAGAAIHGVGYLEMTGYDRNFKP